MATRPPVRRPDELSDEEEARAAELEAEIVARERAADQVRSRPRDRERERQEAGERTIRRSGQSLLEVKAAEEYAYVARDVRRIVTVVSFLVAIMAVFYVAIQVLHVVKVG